jgi:hypothetical protein
MMKYIEKNKSIVLILSFLLLIGFDLWVCSSVTAQFGLNFFTNMLSVAVTVLIIDRLIQNREDEKRIPQKLAAYEDIRLYTSRYIDFWTDLYKQSVPEDDPETIQEFFSENGMIKILKYLYLDSVPNVIPPLKCREWVAQNAKEFKENGDKILDRHSHNLDPAAFGFIHQLTESPFNNLLLSLPLRKQLDSVMNVPRIEILGSYVFPPQNEDYQAIFGLLTWCRKTYLELNNYSPTIKMVGEYTPQNNKAMPPKCMIPKDVLEKQTNEVNAFIQKDHGQLKWVRINEGK